MDIHLLDACPIAPVRPSPGMRLRPANRPADRRQFPLGSCRPTLLGRRSRRMHQRPHGRRRCLLRGRCIPHRRAAPWRMSGRRRLELRAGPMGPRFPPSIRRSMFSKGLLEYERHGGATPQTQDARRSGEDYLLRRSLFRRLSTGKVADEAFLKLSYPNRWRYDVLRALNYFRDASAFDGTSPDPRLAEAIGYVRSRQLPDGRWVQDWSPRGRVWFEIGDGDGQPSRWITLQALRVLDWWDKARL